MIEAIALTKVVAALKAAVLAAGAKEVAGAAVKSTVDTGKRVLGWLKDKLTGVNKAVLDQAIEKPETNARWDTFGSQLRGLIEEDPAFAKEFAAFLKEAMPEAITDTTTQTATVTDASNVNIAQIKGSDNQVNQG